MKYLELSTLTENYVQFWYVLGTSHINKNLFGNVKNMMMLIFVRKMGQMRYTTKITQFHEILMSSSPISKIRFDSVFDFDSNRAPFSFRLNIRAH